MCYSASVIIPVYNAEKYLRRCVESIAFGQERDLEIILIDDCSKDASWEICQELQTESPNIRAIRNNRNSGVSFTRNQGLAHAQGKYILFVDSDDWVPAQFAKKLLTAARQHPDCLPICGLHFIDHAHGEQRDYLWDDGDPRIVEVESAELFDLSDRFLLQQLWNKVFQRELIEKHQIRFDETQSMGEDFQFVLDYMEASKIQTCVVINEPLYYYIRWNTTSLMSTFGFVQNQQEYLRVDQLHRLTGQTDTSQRDKMLQSIKHNYVYHVSRSPNHSRQQKLDAIEKIMGDGKSRYHYRSQKILQAKEHAMLQLKSIKALPARLRGRWMRKQRNILIAQMKSHLHAQGFSIISQNCIGGILYHDMGLEFLSPTINAFIPEPGFVKLVLNLRHYMEMELVMRWGEEYPIGMLDDVEIHFMHYESCEEAKSAWERRKGRINWNKIFIIGTDRDGFDEAVYEQWKQIQYPKILFTAHPEFSEDAVYYPEYQADGQIGDLIPNRCFYRNEALIKKIESFMAQQNL